MRERLGVLGVQEELSKGGEEEKMNIYVGNLSYQVSEEELRKAFEAYGQVESAKIIKDNYSARSKGFGFVEMPVDEEGEAAIAGLNGQDLKGRAVTVNKARPRTESRGTGPRRRD